MVRNDSLFNDDCRDVSESTAKNRRIEELRKTPERQFDTEYECNDKQESKSNNSEFPVPIR
ncbi:hypothetical protein SAMN04489842_3877 [Natronobacterium texcoconense]|uniref:Uncharacterized protein n=1 Tax=Natronobacterium texcoconense TaxID=1095778 RepID=A0A1H1IXH7_NATTX|nr:hypothetical protein SAMN04489842_3877 [Natronobacterium texcoconense]